MQRRRAHPIQTRCGFGLVAGVVSACAAGAPPANNAESTVAPPAVVTEPQFQAPASRKLGPASAGVLTLKTPLGGQSIRNVVEAFFRAVVEESPSQLDAIMTVNAVAQFDNSTGTSAQGSWRRRFSAFDYTAISLGQLYQAGALESFEYDDARRLRTLRDFRLLPADGELLVIAYLRAGQPRLFGSQIHFLLQPSPEGYRVRATYEDFSPR